MGREDPNLIRAEMVEKIAKIAVLLADWDVSSAI
jgi:hypothetical protein